VTVETTKHRAFQFLDSEIAPDNMLIVVALDDALSLGVLGSITHVTWALAAGGRLGVGNDPRYNKSRCFETFPFPNLHTADATTASGAAQTDDATKPSPSRGGLGGDDGVPSRAATEQPHPHPGLPLEGEGVKRDTADRIRNLAEQLDAHRKRQQAAHPGLTLTGMYNVLEKLRSGEALTPKERIVHEQGLVSVLRQLHDELDAAVLQAYGWSDLLPLLRIAHGNAAPAHAGGASAPTAEASEASGLKPLPQDHPGSQADARRAFDDAILERLVALNAARAAEEARGLVRWLRPDFQHPEAARAPEQSGLDTTTAEGDDDLPPAAAPAARPIPWPKDTVDQVRAVADLLAASPVPLSIEEIAARFTARGPWKKRLPKLLEMLVALGRAQEQDGKLAAT